MVEQKDTRLRLFMTSCKHLMFNVEQTDFHPDFLRMYEEAKEFGKVTKALIERTKSFLQPDPAYKTTLLPPNDEYDYAELCGESLKEAVDAFKNVPKSATFYKLLAKAIVDVDKLYKTFVMHVINNTLKPMEKYLNEDLEQIKNEFDKLIRYKKLFDDARNDLKTCKQENIEEAAKTLEMTKFAFEKQANLTTELLQKMPSHIDVQRSAMRQLALGNNVYHANAKEVLFKMLQETKD